MCSNYWVDLIILQKVFTFFSPSHSWGSLVIWFCACLIREPFARGRSHPWLHLRNLECLWPPFQQHHWLLIGYWICLTCVGTVHYKPTDLAGGSASSHPFRECGTAATSMAESGQAVWCSRSTSKAMENIYGRQPQNICALPTLVQIPYSIARKKFRYRYEKNTR